MQSVLPRKDPAAVFTKLTRSTEVAAGCPAPCEAPTCPYRVPQVAARLPAEVALQQALLVTDERQNHHPCVVPTRCRGLC